MSRKWARIGALAFSLVCASIQAQEAKRPWEEYDKLIKARETVAPLESTLFGDGVDLYTGALSFSATDVSLPGNSKLSVAFSRTFKVGNRKGHINDAPLADWDLDVPHVSGVFATDWQSNRCSASSAELARPPQVFSGATVFSAGDYWQGNHANIPGGGEMLYNAGYAAAPSAGGPYYWMTAGLAYFSCLAATKNESGQGFLAITADGTRYWFDWMAQYVEPPLKAAVNTGGQIERRRSVLYATRVEDRFGNWVTYTYNNPSNAPARLISIQANDGRQIIIGYNAQGHVSQVSAGAQTWAYQYSYPTGTTGTLTAVVQPDASRWSINFGALSSTKLVYFQGPPGAGDDSRSCGDPGVNHGLGAEGSIVHPSGAVGTFRVEPARHGRSNVPKDCANYTFPQNDDGDDVSIYPLAYDAFSLARKTVTGAGLSSMQWNYSYTASISFAPNTGPVCTSNCGAVVCVSDACAGTASTTVAGPGGEWARYTYGNSYRYNEGKLIKVEQGMGPTAIAQTQVMGYELATSGQTFPTPVAISPQPYGAGFSSEYTRPLRAETTTQDGVTYTHTVNAFDALARPTSVTRASTISYGYSRSDAIAYHDNLSKWVLGQIASISTGNSVPAQTTFDPVTALPLDSYEFGIRKQRLSYNADGSVATVTDANNHVTALSNWKRGIPQTIQYPATAESQSGSTESAVVNDSGWITATTDENGYTTTYDHDAMGRVSSITHPTGDSVDWYPTTRTFELVNTPELGLPAGHWRQTVSTGNARHYTYYDALWRPVASESHDITDFANTRTQTFQRYDLAGRQAFASYPVNNGTDFQQVVAGTYTDYDALGRPVLVRQSSELGTLSTSTEYLIGGEIKTTNPRGQATRTRYAAWDQPSTDYPIEIFHPEGAVTQIWRDAFFKPTQLRRSGLYAGQTVEAVRKYYYDGAHRLCRTDEPETGSTVMGLDDAGNLVWSAAGLSGLNTTDCDHVAAYNGGRTVTRSYDARHRLTALNFPDGLGNQVWTYTKDGLPAQVTTYNGVGNTLPVINAYHYNKRRLLGGQGETVGQSNWYTWALGYGYDRHGGLATHSYPTGLTVAYAPNALGQPTQAGSYATGVKYHPNGAISSFTYGNGVAHAMSQNLRQLPQVVSDVGVAGYTYSYDANGNPTRIDDNAQGTSFNRYLDYDGLDRLTRASSAMFGGSLHRIDYAYDPLDNLRAVTHAGVREHSYWYNGKNQLTNVLNTAGASVVGLDYDPQGNLRQKNGQTYGFDHGNRLRWVMGEENYRYDALGRRVETMQDDGTLRLFQYSQAGQYMFGWKKTPAGAETTQENVYLGGSLVATIDHNWPSNTVIATKYQHTDALGSPVAVTNTSGAVIERTNYEPYGSAINKTVDGIGYTGHVMDGATGLTYMQQRYFDPTLGRFLSVDPVTANSGTGGNFNRYSYANNSPYGFTDPDGRFGCPVPGSDLCGKTQAVIKAQDAAKYRGQPTLVWKVGAVAVDFVPLLGDFIGIQGAIDDPAAKNWLAAGAGLFGPFGDMFGKGIKATGRGDDIIGTIFHYTDGAGAEAIQASGKILPDAKGRVYLTTDKISPADANDALFMGRGGSKGTHVVEVDLRRGATLRSGEQPNEIIHEGVIRDGRQADIRVKKNEF